MTDSAGTLRPARQQLKGGPSVLYDAVALALSEAFECGVNDLPLTLVLSWFEQKAIVILLTLLALGVKDIRTGPTAPAFLTPALLKVLEEQFGLKGTTTAEADLAEILAA